MIMILLMTFVTSDRTKDQEQDQDQEQEVWAPRGCPSYIVRSATHWMAKRAT
jgi:hypothetical protein